MPIEFSCTCGELLSAEESQVGQAVRCPTCGNPLQVPANSPLPVQPLNYAGGGGGMPLGPIAPPPTSLVRTPAAVAEKFRAAGLPPCYLVIDANGAHINTSFDVSPALQSLADNFAKKLRKRFDVQIVAQAPPDAPSAYIRLVHIDEGNRFLRYFLTFFAGKTVFDIEGQVNSLTRGQQYFHERHKGTAGLLGGGALALLKVSAKILGTKIAKKILK